MGNLFSPIGSTGRQDRQDSQEDIQRVQINRDGTEKEIFSRLIYVKRFDSLYFLIAIYLLFNRIVRSYTLIVVHRVYLRILYNILSVVQEEH